MSTRTPLLERKGTIGIVTSDHGIYPLFMASLMGLIYPMGSKGDVRVASGGSIAYYRSSIVEDALKNGSGWLFLLDADHQFSQELLIRLLNHDKDIIVPLVMMRRRPYRPILWSPEALPVRPDMTDDELLDMWRNAVPCTQREVQLPAGRRPVVEVGEAGCAGMLISREVLEALSVPHFEFARLNSIAAGEDGWFCLKARRAGFRVYCDTGAAMSHLTTANIWPHINEDGSITPTFDFEFNPEHNRLRSEGKFMRPLPGLPYKWVY